jgi:hypothetical protein
LTLISSRRILSRKKMLDFLGGLKAINRPNVCTLYLTPHTTRNEIEASLPEIAVPPDILPQIADSIDKSPAGAVIFWNQEHKCLVIPPFTVTEKLLAREIATEKLCLQLKQDYLIGLMLVRLGAYAVGVCRGENIVSSKVGTGNIHARHRKGGSSAHRFERHRDKQIEYFFSRACQRAREHLEPYAKSLDYLVYGGARATILDLKKQCSFLERLTVPALPPLLDIRQPRQAVLEGAVARIWSSTVYEWREAD